MSTTCPSCGVAVVPGYVRCPKCQRALPSRRLTVAGGTAVSGGLPRAWLIGGGAVALVLVGYLIFGRGGNAATKPATTDPTATTDDQTDDTAPSTTPTPAAPPGPTVPDDRGSPNRVDPEATARDLERALRRERLWSSVEVVGTSVEVRSGSCRDENMLPMIDAARTALHNAGLTRLRCVEQSGAVVFERQL